MTAAYKMLLVANKNQTTNEMIDIGLDVDGKRYIFGQMHIDIFWPATNELRQRLQDGEEVEVEITPIIFAREID